MEHWHGFETARNVAQIYETTIADIASDLSAHFVTIPARSLGGRSYLFRGSDWPLRTLGLLRIAGVPFGGVARSLAACLVSDDVEKFLRRFDQGFEEETEHSSVRLPKPFVLAQGHGEAGYMYHEASNTPVLAVAIPAGVVVCGSAPGIVRALESGLRQRLIEFVQSRSGERQDGEEGIEQDG